MDFVERYRFGIVMSWTLYDKNFTIKFYEINTGVQSINDVFHNVNKVEYSFIGDLILNLIDNVEYVVYALYSRIDKFGSKVEIN
jgi:hypothetical protein